MHIEKIFFTLTPLNDCNFYKIGLTYEYTAKSYVLGY